LSYAIIARVKRLLLAALLLAACSRTEPGTPVVSKEPTSVRGWIADIEQPQSGERFKTVETEAAIQAHLFQSTNIWMDEAPYVSGGVADTGAFILLDVPPGDSTIQFAPPGGVIARLTLQGIPGNADVLLPGIVIRGDKVELSDPNAVKVRLATRVKRATPSGNFAVIAGQRIQIVNTPIGEMVGRHEYPTPPNRRPAPLAKVK
jgi:hypothetical protein